MAVEDRACEVCGVIFPGPSHKKYCSTTCKQRADLPSRARTMLRFTILERDGFACVYCGRNPREDVCKLEIDHVFPASRGGKDSPNNYVTACNSCNSGKSDILLSRISAKTITDYIDSLK